MKQHDNFKSSDVTRRDFISLATVVSSSAVLSGGLATVAAAAKSSSGASANGTKISWRIQRPSWATDAAFDPLIAMLSKHRSVADEVSLIETPGLAFFPGLEYWSQTADILTLRFESMRKAGVRGVGINVLITLGHGFAPLSPPLPFPRMIGLDGNEYPATPCPNRPEFQDHIRAKYTILARTPTDFIWVDEDVTMLDRAPNWGCFCAVCLRLFSEQTDHAYSREELVQALNDPASGNVREAWVERNARTIESLCACVGQAIYDANPKVQTGLMTVGVGRSAYGGAAYERWSAALRATKARPGLGFYWDTPPGPGVNPSRMEILTKAAEVSRQTESYPASLHDKQYEFETWPDGHLLKSSQTAINEMVLALGAAGCNGMSLNTLGWGPQYDEHASLLDHLSRARPYFENILQHAEGLPARGIWSAWSPRILAGRAVRAGKPWLPDSASDASYDMNIAGMLGMIGIPLTARRATQATVLTGRIAEVLTEPELRSILTNGVLMDTMALRVLIDRGLGNLSGVRISGSAPYVDASVAGIAVARMTSDPLNGAYQGALQSTGGMGALAALPDASAADLLEPIGPGVRTLANMEDYEGQIKGPCMTAFENSLGGRVVVTGFSPWSFIHTASKREQLLEVADWISRGKVPVRVVETVPLTPYVRLNDEGTKGIIVLFNTGLGHMDTATVIIRAPENTAVRLISVDEGPAIRRFKDARGWGVQVQNLAAWSTISLLLG